MNSATAPRDYIPAVVTAVKPRRRFIFSLRTVLLAVAVAAIPLAWVSWQLKWIRDRHAALESLSSFGTYEVVPYWVPAPKPSTYRPAPPALQLFGEQGIANIFVWRDDPESNERAATLERLFPEALVRQTPRNQTPK